MEYISMFPHFYRIENSRKGWIDIIRKYQALDESYQLYICDLHFNQNELRKTNKKTTLYKSANPCFLYVLYFFHVNCLKLKMCF